MGDDNKNIQEIKDLIVRLNYLTKNILANDINDIALQIAEINLITNAYSLILEAVKTNPKFKMQRYILKNMDFLSRNQFKDISIVISDDPDAGCGKVREAAKALMMQYMKDHPNLFETIIDTTEYEFIEEEEWRERFANKLNAIMEVLGMTKEELAYKSGVSVISLYSYLTSRSTPSLYNATKLARVLNCTLTDFQVLQIEL